jgi:hypothetical protein
MLDYDRCHTHTSMTEWKKKVAINLIVRNLMLIDTVLTYDVHLLKYYDNLGSLILVGVTMLVFHLSSQ